MDIIQSMTCSRGGLSEKILEYRVFYSHHANAQIMVFEGKDDYIFYRHFLRELKITEVANFTADGKELVLELRDHLDMYSSDNSIKNLYFIDKDFDGLKGFSPKKNTYITNRYSIENYFVSDDILRELLKGEFGCNDDNSCKDIDHILRIYEARLLEFFEISKTLNQIIHSARKSDIPLQINDSSYKKHIKVSLDNVELDENHLKKILKSPSIDIDLISLDEYEEDFNSLDQSDDWRGKFIFEFFKKFLSSLKDDRSSHSPQYFVARKTGINLPVDDSLVGIVSSLVNVPDCFRQFMKDNARC